MVVFGDGVVCFGSVCFVVVVVFWVCGCVLRIFVIWLRLGSMVVDGVVGFVVGFWVSWLW